MKQLLLAFLMLFVVARAESAFTPTKTPVSPKGQTAIIDLPAHLHMENKGGSDGYGLCVNTSIEVAGRWHNILETEGLQEWSRKRPGGSTSRQVPGDLRDFAKDKKVTLPPYVQHTGGDDAFMELIFKTRRMPCMTYAGKDDFYDEAVAHMVNGAYLDGQSGAIIDNNRPSNWVWMTRVQFLNRWKGLDDKGDPLYVQSRLFSQRWPVGGGWVFCWLAPPPPPTEGAAPKPSPLPQPRIVRWDRQVFALGRVVWFCYENDKLLGVFDRDGWHKALSQDSWEHQTSAPPEGIGLPDTQPDRPVEPGPLAPCPGPNCPYRYWVNGIEVDKKTAYAVVKATDETLADDSDKYHLSFVVEDHKHASVLINEWFGKGGALARFSSKVHVQVYKPDSWVVKDRLRKGLTLQEPAKTGGKRVHEYSGTIDVRLLESLLASVFEPKPIRPIPEPEPEPDPVPVPVAPEPAPVPHPVDPAPAVPPAPDREKSWLSLIIAFLVALFWRRK